MDMVNKDKNNKLMSFCIDDDNLFKKFKTIWTNIEHLKITELNTLRVYEDRYMKIKIRIYSDKVYANFCSLDLPGDGVECGSFTIISIDFLLAYESIYYLQVCLDNCAYKIVKMQMIDHLLDNLLIWWKSEKICRVLILIKLLLSLLKMLIVALLFMAIANLTQVIC